LVCNAATSVGVLFSGTEIKIIAKFKSMAIALAA
jgi:hypothetical protein